jgi:hypothetical protein
MEIDDFIVEQIDIELTDMICSDMISGEIWKMDDETLDIALTSMWEDGVEEWKNKGIIIGEA